MDALQQHSWPGNVRELENVVERAMIASERGHAATRRRRCRSRAPSTAQAEAPDNLDAVQRAHIEAVLERCGWRINGSGQCGRTPGHASEHAAVPDEEAGRRRARVAGGGTCAGRRWDRRPEPAVHRITQPVLGETSGPVPLQRRRDGRPTGRRVELELDVPGYTNQTGAGRTIAEAPRYLPCQRTRAPRIDFEATALLAGSEKLRDLGDTQAAGQPHDTTIGVLDNPNPAIHSGFVGGRAGSQPGRSKNPAPCARLNAFACWSPRCRGLQRRHGHDGPSTSLNPSEIFQSSPHRARVWKHRCAPRDSPCGRERRGGANSQAGMVCDLRAHRSFFRQNCAQSRSNRRLRVAARRAPVVHGGGSGPGARGIHARARGRQRRDHGRQYQRRQHGLRPVTARRGGACDHRRRGRRG